MNSKNVLNKDSLEGGMYSIHFKRILMKILGFGDGIVESDPTNTLSNILFTLKSKNGYVFLLIYLYSFTVTEQETYQVSRNQVDRLVDVSFMSSIESSYHKTY